jgi:hypothetical protein
MNEFHNAVRAQPHRRFIGVIDQLASDGRARGERAA